MLESTVEREKENTLKQQYIAEYGLTARQFNSLCSEVKGLIKATGELHKKNIRDSKEHLASLKKAIKALTRKLKKTEKTQREGKKSEKEKLRWQIHHKKRKLGKVEAKIARLAKKKPAICLGGKKLFKAQFNLEANGYGSHREWREEFHKRRANRIFFIGSKDEKWGNQNCQLLPGRLQVRVIPALSHVYGQYVPVPVEFSYGREVIARALKEGRALNYRFVRREKGWYLHVTTDSPPVPKITRRALGAIGVDLNKAHLAWAEINRHGNLIDFGTIATPIQDRSSDQVTATLAEGVSKTRGGREIYGEISILFRSLATLRRESWW